MHASLTLAFFLVFFMQTFLPLAAANAAANATAAATANAAANAAASAEEEHGLAVFLSSHVLGNQPGQIGHARARQPSDGVGNGDICPAERYRGYRADSSLAGSRRVRKKEGE